MTASSALDESDVAIGSPSRRSALVSSSRPPSMASSRRSRWNHWRILDFARDDWAIASQSRDGPAVSLLLVTISTTSAERRTVSSGTSRPLTLAPTQWWPTSVCTA